MASWTEGVWSQDDTVREGYPYITNTHNTYVMDFVNVDPYWDFTQEFPTPKPQYILPPLNFDDVYVVFAQNTNNMGFPYPVGLKTFYNDGAFKGCTNLTQIKIPPTVKSIGYYTFTDTSLTSVTIAPDCMFYENTFPQGCAVNFYANSSIDRIEPGLNSSYVSGDPIVFHVGDDPGEVFNVSEYNIIMRVVDNTIVTDSKLLRYTLSNVDTSVTATGKTGTINFKTCDGSSTYSKSFTYNVV